MLLILLLGISHTLPAQLITSPSTLNFSLLAGNVIGGGTIQVTANTTTDYVVYATSQGGWLSVIGQNVVFGSSLPFGTWESSTPSSASVFVNGPGLAAGTYTGTVTIIACTVDSAGDIQIYGNPINISVNVTVGSPTLSVSPKSLSFQFVASTSPPQTQTLNVALGEAGIDPSLSFASSVTGGSWLSASSIGQLLPGVVTVSANPNGLSPGVFTGSVLITLVSNDVSQCPAGVLAPCSIGTFATPVTMTVEQPTLNISPDSLSFSCIQDGACKAASQTITLSSNGVANYTVVSNANWLLANPTAGSTSANPNITVTINPANLKAGAYQGALTITTSGMSQTVMVDVAVSAPATTISSVVNAASYGVAASGGAASIFGNFPATLTNSASVTPLPTMLDSVVVFVNSIAAPLYYVSSTQINFQIPWEVGSAPNATVTVGNGSWSAMTNVNIQASSPGIFEIDANHDGAILHGDFSLVSASNPAAPGEIVLIYATGLGPVTPAQVDGDESSTTQLATAQNPQVQIGSQITTVAWTGLAPGFVGLYQINAMVPLNSGSGNVPITLTTANGLKSNAAVMAVK